MGGGGGGMGMFSNPPQKVVRLPFHGVCLEHGKREPSSRMRYKLVPVEEYSKDPGLNELLTLVAQRRIPTPVAQAAAWNLNSKMPWQTLAAKRRSRLGGGFHPPYFHLQHLIRARQVVAYAKARGAERKRKSPRATPRLCHRGEPTRPAKGDPELPDHVKPLVEVSAQKTRSYSRETPPQRGPGFPVICSCESNRKRHS
ncbi:MAG: hypothetical protein Ct9H300mP1_27670 [Planctomycetaceae bacterium]|nr:MAG: hypothetical protein Ct9H300mP1_27670 [Planctomycetaceae bacterium]